MSDKIKEAQIHGEHENSSYRHEDHNHDHDHGHHHHHHHHHHGGNQVIMGSAEGHLLGTMMAYTPAILPLAEMNMQLSMKDVVVFIKEHGGTPLQVKASLKDTSTTVLLNMVGSEIFHSENAESTETDPTRVKCKLLVVADGIDDKVLKGALETYMGYFRDNSF